MTIWLLAVLLMAALAALGLRQGVVRVGFSFFGIVFGGLLAAPIGHLLKPLLVMAGLKNPLWLAFLPSSIGFLIILTIFKFAGYVLYHKVDMRFKHGASDTQQIMWERLNHRLGLCLGLFNGAAYLVLVSLAVYLLSYWTYQVATPESDPAGVRLLNRLGADLQWTGMNHVALSINRMPEAYYQAADIAGLIYHNPLLQARLSRYPAILSLAEQSAFQDLANDQAFTEMQMRQAPIMEILRYPKVQAILQNPDTVKTITNALLPNLSDLQNYLETDQSQVFTEPIFGRWDFSVTGTMLLVRQAQPKMTAAEAQKARLAFRSNFAKTTLVAAPPDMAVLKNFPHINLSAKPPTIELQNCSGHWSGGGTSYSVTLSIEGKEQQFTAEVRGDRLNLSSPELNFGFVRED
jgi:hypothetical protein